MGMKKVNIDKGKAKELALSIAFRLYAILIVILMPLVFIAILVSYAIEKGALRDIAMLLSRSLKCILKGYDYE